MTWVRYLATIKAAGRFLKIQRNDPMTHADNIERQREKESGGLIPAWMVQQYKQATQSVSKNTAPAFTGPRFQQSVKSAEESKTPSTNAST